MKFTLILASLMLCQISFAQTVRAERIKQEMLDRVDLLVTKAEEAREVLDREDTVAACKLIKEMFVIYPDHVKATGSHMDVGRGRSVRANKDALNELIFIHKQSIICDQGKDSEYVDPGKLRKELKEIVSSLKKQKKQIKKMDTDHSNQYRYEYEF